MIEPGQLILLTGPKGKRYIRLFDPADSLHCNEGVVPMEAVARAGFGGVVNSHLDLPFRIGRPTLYDYIKYGMKRQTQILYPKEIGYILMRLGIGAGSHVIEAGTGSGSMTVALSHAVGQEGRVFTYERRPEFAELAQKNLARCGLGDNVEQFVADVAQGFEQTHAHALFLDLRDPWEYLTATVAAIRPGAPVCFLLPVVNQIDRLLIALENQPFDDIEVVEILLRKWKPVPDRLRPHDRMVAHTGFLVFARHQQPCDTSHLTPGTRQRKQDAARKNRQ